MIPQYIFAKFVFKAIIEFDSQNKVLGISRLGHHFPISTLFLPLLLPKMDFPQKTDLKQWSLQNFHIRGA